MNNALIHLAVVADMSPPGTGGGASSAAEGPALLELFSAVAGKAFDDAPSLTHLSLFSPQMQEWFSDPSPSQKTLTALEEGLLRLRSATGLDSGLAILGSPRELPAPWKTLFRHSPAARNASRRVNLFVNYSGRREICEAARRCLAAAAEGPLDEAAFSSGLLTAGQPDPDLVIFAGGPLEPKDFLLWQSSYAEIWHTAKPGLDFSGKDLEEALEGYTSRQRRFGLI